MFYRQPLYWFLFALLLCAAPCLAQQTTSKSAATYPFAVKLFEEGDYFRAVTEFKRYEFECPSPAANLQARYAVAVCYQYAHDWVHARDTWFKLMLAYPDAPVAQEAGYRVCESYMGAGDYVAAGASLDEYLTNADRTNPFYDDAIFLRALAAIANRDVATAQTQFTTLGKDYPQSPLNPAAQLISAKLATMEKMPRKSPHVAALLSTVLPGSGQIYAGRTRDGIMAFLVNAASISLTVNRFNRDDTTGGYLTGFAASSFYFGNIYGAGGAASAENRKHQDQLVDAALKDASVQLEKKLGHQDALRPMTVPASEDTPADQQ